MPRFYFDVQDGNSSVDHEGMILADLREARLEAIAAAADMIKEDGAELVEGSVWMMSILDCEKNLVCRLSFSADFGEQKH